MIYTATILKCTCAPPLKPEDFSTLDWVLIISGGLFVLVLIAAHIFLSRQKENDPEEKRLEEKHKAAQQGDIMWYKGMLERISRLPEHDRQKMYEQLIRSGIGRDERDIDFIPYKAKTITSIQLNLL